MECKSCGAQFSDDSSICPYCQKLVGQEKQVVTTLAPIASAIQNTKPKGARSTLILLVLICWPAAIWYGVTRDLEKK